VTTTETATVRPAEVVELPPIDVITVAQSPPPVDTAEPLATAEAVAPRTGHVVLRHVEPTSVLKLSLVFYLCVCGVLLVAGVVLWLGASITGVVGNFESFIRDAGFNDFKFAPGQLLKAFTLISLIIVGAGTMANMLLAALFNLMSDLVGGVRVTLAEDVDPHLGR
jgi:hypothetical protein